MEQKGRGGRGWYLPHRALVLLGAVLMVMAVTGGTLGVIEATRAQQASSTLSDRYLVLQPPARELRASLAAFQIVMERTLAGGTVSPASLEAAVVDSNETDRTYPELERLLESSGDTALAPRLVPRMSALVAARDSLASLLGGAAPTPRTAGIAASERIAYGNLDDTVAGLQDAVSAALVRTAAQVREAATAARDDLLFSMVIGVLFGVCMTSLLVRKAVRVERESAREAAAQARLTRRNEFEARLQRALEMSRAEPSVFEPVAEALAGAAPEMRSELLLADSARAHFRQVLVRNAENDPDRAGCGVVSPDDCPAASRGQTMTFPSSTAIDACPNLRGRACSALCVPVSISGDSMGVIHIAAPDGSPPSDEVRGDVEVVARRASERLAMLRAFEHSQAEANSDSLTGLQTRRSLEHGVQELQRSGSPYVVAYGDLDHFKQLNDAFGHDAGDRALRTFSQVLRDSLRPADLACRYGGEEFVIVLPSCAVSEATQVLERVRDRLAGRLTVSGQPVFTVSFGLASTDDAVDFAKIVTLADGALLRAKAGGRDQIVAVQGEPGEGELSSDGVREVLDFGRSMADPIG